MLDVVETAWDDCLSQLNECWIRKLEEFGYERHEDSEKEIAIVGRLAGMELFRASSDRLAARRAKAKVRLNDNGLNDDDGTGTAFMYGVGFAGAFILGTWLFRSFRGSDETPFLQNRPIGIKPLSIRPGYFR